MRIDALVLAAGGGTRFGGDRPKQLAVLAGEPVLAHSLRTIGGAGVDRIVVVAHASWQAETEAVVRSLTLGVPSSVVVGGRTRGASTRNGLASLGSGEPDDVVLVHDAARPLVSADLVRRALGPVVDGSADATDPLVPTADTIAVVARDRVVDVPDRSTLRQVQTPQVFRREVLVRAFEAMAAAGDEDATDDCSVVLRHVPGARILAVAGEAANLKVTTPLDLALAELLLAGGTPPLAPTP